MARIGMNPSRSKTTDYRPARVTVAVLIHIPHLTGYYEGRLQVLQACLQSIFNNTEIEHDLLLFDNASCEPVQAYLAELVRSGQVEYLIRSEHNLGKIGAFKVLFPAAPGELIAYSDDDFYFEPGWLKAQMRILDTFPNVGMVSGYVIPTFFHPDRIGTSLAWARGKGVSIQSGKFIDPHWIADWAESTGRDPQVALEAAKSLEEHLLEYKGVQAFAAANHDQFLAPRSVMMEMLPQDWGGQLMGEMLALDERVNAAGYLRLATRSRTTRHMGNQLPADIAHTLGIESEPSKSGPSGPAARSLRWRFLKWRPVRAVLLGIYSHLFHWINPE